MPKQGDEVQVTDLEVAILRVFIERKMLNDDDIVPVLKTLTAKLEGKYAKTIKGN